MSINIQRGAGGIADNSVTLAKMASGTDGNIISYDASGDPVAIATGNDGEVLTSAGSGNPPAFEAAAGGGDVEFVSTAALTTTTTVEVNNMAAGYDYMVVFEAFAPTSDAQRFSMRFSDDAGSSFESGGSDYRWSHIWAGGATVDDTDDMIDLTGDVGNDAGGTGTIHIDIINPNASGESTSAIWYGYTTSDSNITRVTSGGGHFLQGTDAVEDVQFLWSGGSTFKAQGDITVWRRKRS